MTARSRRVTIADLMSYFSGDYLELDRRAAKQAPVFFAPASPAGRSLMPMPALGLLQEVPDR